MTTEMLLKMFLTKPFHEGSFVELEIKMKISKVLSRVNPNPFTDQATIEFVPTFSLGTQLAKF